ncbi:uncharacterized protein GGS22DRAFT_174788 [Annulohypoxylon maeteangense]|uniref:uncharacterized protein n=1 Tax=Annulohypoxylon maeteangense TaxID=1927788 RepID=UPI0020071E4C|nr:uncharacterized protein GGS22DRAFT_174788 [Annulohypoxylon maeteangense]KAI0880597.1 hypothetical protein GGS22DRAFT_174788 [Annulohypoxylon maeteangense]
MYRSALRSTPRAANTFRHTTLSTSGRRFASTTPPAGQKRSWKSAAVRWGIAVGAVYWYSTSAVFAEEPLPKTIPPPPQFSDEDLPTVEAVVAQKRREAEARLRKAPSTPEPATAGLASEISPSAPVRDVETHAQDPPPEGSPEALEEEAGQQGAFNPETGEINWDCPCLGGMAHGPCGEEFKAAFSCFVYSKEEPKGMDCIDKFQHMQDCFRLHPEVYGEELDEDETSAEGTPEDGAKTSVAKTTTTEYSNTVSRSEESQEATKAISEEAKTTGAGADAEVGAVAKETEKQNIPPVQP